MSSVINPSHSRKERKRGALHQMYAVTACSLAILFLGKRIIQHALEGLGWDASWEEAFDFMRRELEYPGKYG